MTKAMWSGVMKMTGIVSATSLTMEVTLDECCMVGYNASNSTHVDAGDARGCFSVVGSFGQDAVCFALPEFEVVVVIDPGSVKRQRPSTSHPWASGAINSNWGPDDRGSISFQSQEELRHWGRPGHAKTKIASASAD